MNITPMNKQTVNIDTSEDDTVFLYIENKEVVIKHNDVGLSIDVYDLNDEESPSPQYNWQIWFTDRQG